MNHPIHARCLADQLDAAAWAKGTVGLLACFFFLLLFLFPFSPRQRAIDSSEDEEHFGSGRSHSV